MKNNIFNIFKYIKNFGFKSVVVLRAFKLFAIMFLIAVILITAAYSGIVSAMRKTLISENKSETKKVAAIFDNILREAEYLAAKSLLNRNTKTFLSLADESLLDTDMERRLMSSFNSYNTDIKKIYLYNKRIDCIITNEGKSEKNMLFNNFWLDNIDEGYNDNYKIVFKKNKNNALHSVFLIKKDAVNKSYIAVELDIHNIKNKFKNLINPQSQIYITLKDEILYSNYSYDFPTWFLETTKKSEGYLKNQGCVFGTVTSEYYEVSYTVCSLNQNNMKGIKNMYIIFVGIFIFVMIAIIAVSLAISFDSFNYINNFMNIFETKKLPDKLKDNEIKFISDRIVFLINDNDKLKSEIESKVEVYNEMQNVALQKQIMPHFINNSLNALGTSIINEHGYNSKSIKMLTKLSRIIKYSNISENVFVTLGEELDFVNEYLSFLKYRYEKFEYNLICSPELRNQRIMKMMLQPFCENSVFHGIKNNSGTLNVIIEEKNGKISIIIEDDGAGIDESIKEKLLDSTGEMNFKNKNVGIRNVIKRLSIVYGELYDIKIESEQNKYTKVIIELPKV